MEDRAFWIFATLPIAALFGFAISNFNSCAVASMEKVVAAREFRDLALKMLAMGVASVLLFGWHHLPLAAPHLPAPGPFSPAALSGGIILGLGSCLNGACFVGTVMRAARGRLGFLITLAGLFAAVWIYPEIYMLPTMRDEPRQYRDIAHWPYLVAGIGPVVLLAFVFRRFGKAGMKLILAAILAGISGATMFGLDPQWTYLSSLDRLSRGGELSRELIAAYLFAGSIIGAWSAERFHLSWFAPREFILKFAGGFLMGFGALLIPGGNEALMFWAMPSFAPHALAAYSAMIITIAVTLFWAKALRPQQRLDL